MKKIIALSVLSLSLLAQASFAGEITTGPVIEPGQPINLDTSALDVLLFEVPADKVADLKEGANTIKAEVRHLGPENSVFTFTSQSCHSGIVFLCRDIARLRVDGTFLHLGEISRFTYKAGAVERLQK